MKTQTLASSPPRPFNEQLKYVGSRAQSANQPHATAHALTTHGQTVGAHVARGAPGGGYDAWGLVRLGNLEVAALAPMGLARPEILDVVVRVQ